MMKARIVLSTIGLLMVIFGTHQLYLLWSTTRTNAWAFMACFTMAGVGLMFWPLRVSRPDSDLRSHRTAATQPKDTRQRSRSY